MLRRPKSQETEEDLLQQQKEFFEASGKLPVLPENHQFDVKDEKEKSIPLCENIVLDIKEKSLQQIPSDFQFKIKQNKGFPKVFVIDSHLNKSKKNEKSLFALAVEKNKKGNYHKNTKEETNLKLNEMGSNFNNEKLNFDTLNSEVDILKKSVHDENVEKLSQMPENQILMEQKNLLKSLDPSMVKFLKNRHKKDFNVKSNVKEETNVCSPNYENVEIKEKLMNYLDCKWINMDFIEKEKLEWIGDIPDKKTLEPDQPYSARFNFQGELLPFKMEIDVRTSLYHHGEEPDRPGYTIQELYQLSRSQVLQQRIFALNTLANLIRKSKLGYYDNCFDGILLKKLVESDLYFLLRFSIDDNASISASVFCLHSLICNECDEFCLDKLLGVTNFDNQPFLFKDIKISNEEEGELKDHTIASCDLIKGIIRTDLLARLSYILNNCYPNEDTIFRIINCLIRISRHSVAATLKILDTPGLLEKLFTYVTNRKPIPVGVKLLRIMSSQSQEIAKTIINKFDVMSIIRFVENDEFPELTKKESFMLKLETLYLWRNFLNQNLLVNEYLSWSCVLIRLLLFYVEKVDVKEECEFDFELFSGITSLIIVCNKKKIIPDLNVTMAMKICLEKWLTQLIQKRVEYNFSISKAIGSIFRFFVTFYKAFGETNSDLTITFEAINRKLLFFFQSEIFQKMGSALIEFSYILRPSIPTARDPENLPSLATIYQGGHDFLRIVQHSSSLPFFTALTKYLILALNISMECKTVVKRFIDSNPIRNYINLFMKSRILVHVWFLRYETNFLVRLLRILVTLGDDQALPLSFRLLPTLRKDDANGPKVLREIFNSNNWPNCKNLPEEQASVYIKLILEDVNKSHLNYTSDLIPESWPYYTLTHLKDECQDEIHFIGVLEFLALVLNYKPKLFDGITFASRYYFTCYAFLRDSLLFNDKVQKSLETIYKDIIKNKENVILNVKLDGKKSFYDLYTELIIQYAGVSYGLSVFARFILFPLQNNQDVAFRKLLWFEYLHVLRVITLPFPVNDFIDLKHFVEPCETDESLLVAYINSISKGIITKNRNPFVFYVAVGNIKNFMASNSKNEKLVGFMKNKIENLSDAELKNDLKNDTFY